MAPVASNNSVNDVLGRLGLDDHGEVLNQNPYAKHPLLPVNHEIAGTDPESVIFFNNVKILDCTGKEPYQGNCLIKGQRIVATGPNATLPAQYKERARVIEGNGRTLMPGLCDAHTHFTWNNGGNLDALGELPVEEHLLFAIRAARTYLDSGFTSCLGAASAKDRLDVVCRDAINAGDIAGPRYLANAKEIAKRDGCLIASITAFADGPQEMAQVAQANVDLGADQIKLSMSGEEITESMHAEDNYFSVEETKAACDVAHAAGKRVCAHARSGESVKVGIENGVDIIYHASFAEKEEWDLAEKHKDHIWVAPGVNWIVATLNDAAAFGYPPEKAEAVGYKKELAACIRSMKEFKKRGVKILPGGDYGFAWTPHGTYARDLQWFVELFDHTPMEAILAATALGGDIFMRPHELGKVLPGYYADLLLVDGNPLDDVRLLQDHDKLNYILINGRIHKQCKADEAPAPPIAGQDGGRHVIVPNKGFLRTLH
ncbi:uncharacterized protein L969DRAFT_91804 [Mixia osmundae IAM 14324]|uniref:Plant heme peroxidase family profile domain-containing protein n=1 Tax=Mixia osmundae (strain CBS 9802 / IAM 14324 / JCM 22182 / KY 12970) TaxID=764103 RepID=G7EAK3_MIXOS|nr:uncharacterized protein L969DRAFT_91804 [Mixia osmundae IAM 14324]KEI42353.1 hypothetical protein L969DRAFT_91804 [Mixia osmundae IAM 14324]GAA99863.1 hypothetical protein E5Q_06566 [Mixia osmundae IAM 14324]